MTPRESSLWKWLEKGKPTGCLMKRIENSVSDDFPDVLGEYRGGAFMVELKVAELRKGNLVKIKLSSGQSIYLRDWNCQSLKTWVLIQIPDIGRVLISGGHYSKDLLRPVTMDELRFWSPLPFNAIAAQIIARMAGK